MTITPPVGTWQAGFGARSRPSESVHDDLYARVLVLGDGSDGHRIALVALDLIGLERDSVQRIRARVTERTGITGERLLLSCSHTHAGPSTLHLAGLGDGTTPDQPADVEYVTVTERAIAGAVQMAAGGLRPATLALGEGSAQFPVNRRRPGAGGGIVMEPHPGGVVDRRVGLLRVDCAETPEGPPLALVYHLACHPTAMGSDNYLLSGDWPGQVNAFLESTYGPGRQADGTVALFLQGCAGDIKPNVSTPGGRFRSATWPELARLGRALGGELVRATEEASALPLGDGIVLGATTASATLPFAALPERDSLKQELGGRPHDRGWASALVQQLDAGGLPSSLEADVQVLRIGALRLVAMPGEIFLEIGLRIRAALGEPTWSLGYANGLYLGYVATAAALAEGGYETQAYRYWLHPAPLGPRSEALLEEAARRAAAAGSV